LDAQTLLGPGAQGGVVQRAAAIAIGLHAPHLALDDGGIDGARVGYGGLLDKHVVDSGLLCSGLKLRGALGFAGDGLPTQVVAEPAGFRADELFWHGLSVNEVRHNLLGGVDQDRHAPGVVGKH
jgi:hypothetical protein